MFPEAENLRDIHEVMGNPWWPPAPGWWLLLAAVCLLALTLWRFDRIWRLRIPIPLLTLGSWRLDAARALRKLRRDLRRRPTKESASELSELLRRIAMASHGRGACAGLHGDDWLVWLSDMDPKGFDWHSRARLLLDAPYAPPGADEADLKTLATLLDAAMDWVAAKDVKPRPKAKSRAARRRSWLKPWTWRRGAKQAVDDPAEIDRGRPADLHAQPAGGHP